MPAAALLTVASMPAAGIVQQHRRRVDREPVPGVGDGAAEPEQQRGQVGLGHADDGHAVGEGHGGRVDHRRAVGAGRVRADVDDGVGAGRAAGAKVHRLGGAGSGRAGSEAVGRGSGRGADRRHRTGRLELAREGLVAVEGLRAGEAGEFGRDVGQREGPRGARGDRGQVEDRASRRVGVVRELEDRVGEEGRQAGGVPGAAVPGEEARLVDHPGLPARPRHQPHPGAVDPVGDVEVPAGPGAGSARGDDVAGAVGRARRRRGQVPVEDRELHEPVEQPQRLVDGDVLLRLRRQEVRQQEVGAGVGHGIRTRG